jgi:hypothetical protein
MCIKWRHRAGDSDVYRLTHLIAGQIMMKFDMNVNTLTATKGSSFKFPAVGNNNVGDAQTCEMEGGGGGNTSVTSKIW